MSSSEASGIYVRNNFELDSASLSASLVSFERRSSSCIVIGAEILASWANISKQKEIRFNESLKKNPSRGLNTPFRFDILAQLANIPARITLLELLRLSKKTREALRDALADSESFLMQVPIPTKDDGASCPRCHLLQQKMPVITFTAEDMLLKDNKHDRPLYYAGYIGSTFIKRVQVDPGSALSIIPKRLPYFLEIPLNRLSAMTTTIYGFNAGSSHPLEKNSASLSKWRPKIESDMLHHRC